MKFTILQENLAKSLGFLQKAIPRKPQLPILSSILLETKDNKLILSATDLYLGIKSQSVAKVEKEARVVVPGDIFKQFITSLNPGQIEFELKENNLLVKAGKSRIKIPTQNSDDYPDFPKVKGKKFTLAIKVLEKIGKYVGFAASIDQTRPVLTAVLLKFLKEGLEVVATDGFRLSTLLFPEIKSEQEMELLVPNKALGEVYRIATQAEDKVKEVNCETREASLGCSKGKDNALGQKKLNLTLSKELKQIKFEVNDTEVYVRLIEGEYPPYQKIIPQTFELEVNIDGDQLVSEIKRAFILARDVSNIIKLEIKGNSLFVRSNSPSYGNYEGVVEIENKSGQGGELAFNAKYLLEFLNTVKPKLVKFEMNESLKPTMFSVDEVKNYKYIIMPFRVNE